MKDSDLPILNIETYAPYWFVQLYQANTRGEHEVVSESQKRLRDLGYDIVLREPKVAI